MRRRNFYRSAAAIALGTSLLAAPLALAQSPEPVRVRGTVIGLTDTALTVKTREGTEQSIALTSGWKVSGITTAAVEDIKPGDYVGIASLPKAEGGDGALEVLIFPDALKGANEGSFAWDLKPKSSMTNATVADAVKSVAGHTVTVNFKGQEKTIDIPDGTPVVTFAAATKDDLKPGAAVFVPSEKAADGTVSSGQIVVGTDGVVPPM